MATEVYQPPQIVSDDTGIYFASYPSANSTTRTNLQVYSEAFDNAAWAKIRSVINAEYTTAPDGSSTACQLVDDSSTGTNNIRVEDAAVTATSTAYTHSVFAKADTLTWLLFEVAGSGTQSIFAYLDLSNGAVGNTGADNVSEGIEDAGNGWYRCWISYVSDSVDTSIVNRVYAAEANGDIVVDLDGTSSILIWGYQMEASAFLTSYIRTKAFAVPSPRLTSFYSDPNNVVFVGDAQIVGRVPVVSVA